MTKAARRRHCTRNITMIQSERRCERTDVVIRYVFVTTFVRLSLADLVYAAVMDSISLRSLEKQASQMRRDETVDQ